MRAVDIITKKRDGGTLSDEEITAFVDTYVRDEVADYQAAALLMAILLRGMNFDETAALTRAMMNSGEVYQLDSLGLGTTVDKHSTGGVGDKISLPLAPLVAACGVAVPMVSGRGLGHTGGTLDKLESIPGYRTRLTQDEFKSQLQSIGVSIIGQSEQFVPADRKLYALRDVTGTVESIPLICASIMSKKVASGAHAFVMDVKTGSGAFMQTLERSRELARGLMGVGAALQRPVRAIITDMSQPLGRMIGNSVEVLEAVDCLRGEGPADVREITLTFAADMLALGLGIEFDDAFARAKQTLDSGAALEKFRDMVKAQGGDPRFIDDPGALNLAPGQAILESGTEGFLTDVNCREIGIACSVLGAGRSRTTDSIDPGVGLEMLVRIGDRIQPGQPLVRIVHRNLHGVRDCMRRLTSALKITESRPQPPPLIVERLA